MTQTQPVVLAGVDGTRSGRLALRVAAERAASLGADLVGVHVSPALPWVCSATASPELLALAPQLRQDLEADAFFDTATAAEHAGVNWSFVLAEGDVAKILRREAKDRDAAMVVVAAHAEHRGLHRCPARRLAHACDRPVVVVDADVCGMLEEAL
jgi:nucleotide-binding universal stress UspA family protein